MNIHTSNSFSQGMFSLGTALAIALMLPAVAASQLSTYSNPSPVPLGTTGTYGALSYAGMSGSANVHGDVGSSNSTVGVSIIPAGTNWTFVDNNHNLAAQTDLTAALTNANDHVARPTDFTIPANLDGLTLYKGIYDGGALDLASNGTLTLSGNATDVFIIRASSTLTINTNSTIALAGSAVWSNVYWYVGTSATIYSGSTFNGNVLAAITITLNASATMVHARLLASTGAVTINSPVLPVEFTAFTGAANRMNAELHWSTATEINNSGFEVERRQAADWSKVGFVTGAGTSNAPRDYSFTDNNLASGRYTYRLKQVDNNGGLSYYGSLEVTIGPASHAFALSQNYPNPFNPSTMINYSLENAAQVSLKVYNVVGEEVATLVNGRQEAGSYTVRFNTTNGTNTLSNGVYFYRLESGAFVSTKKLIIMK